MEYIVAIPFIVMLYMIFTANRNRIVAHTVQAPITQNLRLYFISDVHNRTINQRMLKRLGPVDAVIIGGDFCDRRTTLTKLEKISNAYVSVVQSLPYGEIMTAKLMKKSCVNFTKNMMLY